ncbi:MAG: ATP-binding domain-containing protein [Gordonibacter sp.]
MDQGIEDQQHLETVLEMVREALGQATNLLEGIDGSYHDTKRYLAEARGEIDPSEKFQSELALSEVDRRAAVAGASKAQLEKLLDSPYFARVDFKPEDGEGVEAYVGRFAFRFGNRSIVSDWRSPVAGLFYDYELGVAEYEAPTGTVRGAIVGKRQFRIEHGRLVYAVDSASSVRDEVLQRELSRTSDRKMRTIISSIQKEQNALIRDERPGTLVIQGVAGSGKTSIALHRIAYLLYRQKERLNSKSVVILSPNRVFGDYISILGDCFQMVDGREGLDEQEVAAYYPDARTARLMRSYRSTYEVVELARRIKPICGLEAVARHGEEPLIAACRDTRDVLDQVGRLIERFQAGEGKTLGILHKSDELAQRYAELLALDHEVHFVGRDSVTFSEGVTVASAKMAKGLEFDEVIVLDVDSRQYATAADRNLLYVAVTRAMHWLSLLYRGEPAEFLAR